MIFIILILAIIAGVGVYALLNPKKQAEARSRIAAQKEAKAAAKKRVEKKIYARRYGRRRLPSHSGPIR